MGDINQNIMLISIIVPSYNRSRYILDTLESVVNQRSPNWECVIVDDGSTDNTDSLVQTFIQEHKTLPITYRKNERAKGAQGARNTGILHSTGEYLIFLDSDDILDTNCVAQRLDAVTNHPGYDYYAFPIRLFNKTPGDSSVVWNIMNKPGWDILDRFLVHDAPWQTLGCLWKRETLMQLGMWDEKVTSLQDWDIHIQAVLRPSLKGWLCPDELAFDAFYRVGSYDSISKKFASRKGMETNIYLVDKTFSKLEEYHLRQRHLPAFRQFFWIMYTLISITDSQSGKALFEKYSPVLELNAWQHFLYGFFIRYRFNKKMPKIVRGLMSFIPRVSPVKNMLEREDTCMKLEIKDIAITG